MPLFGGKRRDPGDAFEEARVELATDHDELQEAWRRLSSLDEWRTFADVRRRRLEWDRDQTEKFGEALISYDKALRNLFQAFSRLKRELPL